MRNLAVQTKLATLGHRHSVSIRTQPISNLIIALSILFHWLPNNLSKEIAIPPSRVAIVPATTITTITNIANIAAVYYCVNLREHNGTPNIDFPAISEIVLGPSSKLKWPYPCVHIQRLGLW